MCDGTSDEKGEKNMALSKAKGRDHRDELDRRYTRLLCNSEFPVIGRVLTAHKCLVHSRSAHPVDHSPALEGQSTS